MSPDRVTGKQVCADGGKASALASAPGAAREHGRRKKRPRPAWAAAIVTGIHVRYAMPPRRRRDTVQKSKNRPVTNKSRVAGSGTTMPPKSVPTREDAT